MSPFLSPVSLVTNGGGQTWLYILSIHPFCSERKFWQILSPSFVMRYVLTILPGSNLHSFEFFAPCLPSRSGICCSCHGILAQLLLHCRPCLGSLLYLRSGHVCGCPLEKLYQWMEFHMVQIRIRVGRRISNMCQDCLQPGNPVLRQHDGVKVSCRWILGTKCSANDWRSPWAGGNKGSSCHHPGNCLDCLLLLHLEGSQVDREGECFIFHKPQFKNITILSTLGRLLYGNVSLCPIDHPSYPRTDSGRSWRRNCLLPQSRS